MKRSHPVSAGLVGALAALVLFATVPWVRSCALGVARGAACCSVEDPLPIRARRMYERRLHAASRHPG